MPQELMLINPRRRRRRRKMSALQAAFFGGGHKRKSRRHRRRHHGVMRLRRNPSLRSSVSSVMDGIVPAAIGGAGALASDYALQQFGPMILPASLLTGPLYPVTRIGAALGIGMLAGMVAGHRIGNQVTAGALVVTAYDLIKTYVGPSIGLSRYVGAGRLGMSRYVGGGRLNGVGYINPARTTGFPGSNIRAIG